MEYRTLGRTGEKLSVVGFGGILAAREEQATANRFVAEALDAGVTYIDVAPMYHDAEDRLGPALEGRRNQVFLACKTELRTKDAARGHLEASLKKLRTDRFDLYQFHAVASLDDVEAIFAPGGAMETFEAAKKQGLVRHLGFSAHSDEAALAMMERYDFDSILYPINWVNLLQGSFVPRVLAEAQRRGMGILALKAMAKTKLVPGAVNPLEKAWYEPVGDEVTAKLAYRYSLSQGLTAAIPPGYMKWFRWAVEAASPLCEITKSEVETLRKAAQGLAPLFPVS